MPVHIDLPLSEHHRQVLTGALPKSAQDTDTEQGRSACVSLNLNTMLPDF
jgi:hypothetical protein